MSTHNYLFVSDLHLSEGRDPETGRFRPMRIFSTTTLLPVFWFITLT